MKSLKDLALSQLKKKKSLTKQQSAKFYDIKRTIESFRYRLMWNQIIVHCGLLSIIHQNTIFNDLLTLENDYPDIILHMFTMMALLDQRGFAINYRAPNSIDEKNNFCLQMRILFRHFYPEESMVIMVGWPWWEGIYEFWRSSHKIADWLSFFKDEVLFSKGWVTREYMENLFKTILLFGEGDLAQGMARYERHPEDIPIKVTVSTTDQEPSTPPRPTKKRRKSVNENLLECIRDVFSTHECSLEIIHKIIDEMHSTKTLPSLYYYLLKAEYLDED